MKKRFQKPKPFRQNSVDVIYFSIFGAYVANEVCRIKSRREVTDSDYEEICDDACGVAWKAIATNGRINYEKEQEKQKDAIQSQSAGNSRFILTQHQR